MIAKTEKPEICLTTYIDCLLSSDHQNLIFKGNTPSNFQYYSVQLDVTTKLTVEWKWIYRKLVKREKLTDYRRSWSWRDWQLHQLCGENRQQGWRWSTKRGKKVQKSIMKILASIVNVIETFLFKSFPKVCQRLNEWWGYHLLCAISLKLYIPDKKKSSSHMHLHVGWLGMDKMSLRVTISNIRLLWAFIDVENLNALHY